MEKVPIKALKQRMAHFLEFAAKGHILQITKHNKPYVFVVPFSDPSIHIGSAVGQKALRAGKKIRLKKSIELYLSEDRDENR